MLMHYIYLGEPNTDLLVKILTLLAHQRNPSLSDSCGHPQAKFWTLNENTKGRAQEILATILPEEHPIVHLEIVATTYFLYSAIQYPQVRRYSGRIRERDATRSAAERHSYYAATQMLYDYFNNILNPNSLAGVMTSGASATMREYVTGKELLALWIAYTYGGVIMDAGCQADPTVPAWDFTPSAPLTFQVPYLRHEESRGVLLGSVNQIFST